MRLPMHHVAMLVADLATARASASTAAGGAHCCVLAAACGLLYKALALTCAAADP
jgi:hypothetical protein